ncbi:MAG: alpha/beta hydrolase [Candidatus Cloacimonetes bacterium]|nr:alpha/beta hydrolase [Candidatus Cloacimonadota bacterium]
MKRILPVLVHGLWLVVCGLAPAFAQGFIPDNRLILPESGKVSILTIQTNPPCDGQLSLYQPYEKLISTSLMPPAEKWVEVGYFNANTELVFKLELNDSSPSCRGTIFSTNSDFGYLLHTEGSNYWYFVESDYFVMAIWLDTSASGGPPLHHPAIFIHGLGGRPDDWTTGGKRIYFDTLKVDPYNYPSDYLVTYPYADADNNPATYDYQGDVTKISADLEGYVNTLSQKHLADGGDGKVDLVGFSLGGLVARQYLNTHPTHHHVRKVITIGSPHEGSYLLRPEVWFNKIPIAGEFMKRAVNAFLNNVFNTLRDGGNRPLDLNSMAIQQIVPGNSFLQWLNDLLFVPTDPSYNALYGNIDAELRQKIFFFELKKRFTLGDGLILEDSATGIPVVGLQTFEFTDSPVLGIQVKTAKIPSGGYEYVLDVPSVEDYRVYHSNLIVHPDVVQKVIELLTQN